MSGSSDKAKTQQVQRSRVDFDHIQLSTQPGVRVGSTVGERGPMLLEDFSARETITHFDLERHNHRDSHGRYVIHKGRTSYHKNGIGGECPAIANSGTFSHSPEHIEEYQIRTQTESCTDCYRQANVDYELAARAAAEIGCATTRAVRVSYGRSSPALSPVTEPAHRISTRRGAVRIADGVDATGTRREVHELTKQAVAKHAKPVAALLCRAGVIRPYRRERPGGGQRPAGAGADHGVFRRGRRRDRPSPGMVAKDGFGPGPNTRMRSWR